MRRFLTALLLCLSVASVSAQSLSKAAGGSGVVPSLTIQNVPTAGATWLTVDPIEAGASTVYGVMEGFAGAGVGVGSRANQVMRFGWNIGANGARVDTGDSALADEWESYYTYDSGTNFVMERHLAFTDIHGTLTRPWTVRMNRDTSEVLEAWNANKLYFFESSAVHNPAITLEWGASPNMNFGYTGSVGGTDNYGAIIRVQSGQGAEQMPAITAGNWTVGSGWAAVSGGVLDKNANGTGTATTTAASTIVGSTLYKLTITFSSFTAGSATIKIGAQGTGISFSTATTYTDYVMALDTTKLTITPTNTSRFTISAISLIPLTTLSQNYGSLTMDGYLTVNSRIKMRGDLFQLPADGVANSGAIVWGAESNTGGNPIARLDMSGLSLRAQVASSVGGALVEMWRSTNSYSIDLASSSVGSLRMGNNKVLALRSTGNNDVNALYMDTSNNLRLASHADFAAVVMGPGDASATPGGITLRGANATGTDINGVDFTIGAPLGTGAGSAGRVITSGAAAIGSTGTTAQTAITRKIDGNIRAIANNTTTTVATATLANNTVHASKYSYAVQVFDGTDLQVEEGTIVCHITNKGNTPANNTCVKFGNQQAATSGTLTVTWTITAASPALIQVNANSSLTPSTGYPRVTFNAENLTSQAFTAP